MTNSITKMKLMLLALCVTFITSQEESISPYEEIKKFVKTFKPRGMNASTYYLLSIDVKHNNLVVGARNRVFLVNLDDMKSYEYWNVPQQPGDSAFFKMMLPFGDRILLCWVEKPSTGSCTWRNRTTLGEAPESNQGYVFKSNETYNAPSSSPDQNDTAIITEDGTLFVGTFLTIGGFSIIYSKRFKHPQLTEVFSARRTSFYEGT
ncbi:semaphorin-5A-like [Acropora muricata]|uniref:semaphorin-5A-like n=1 Tax=Acropora muricata TaxID=159855 RepID=UPI0034E4CE84